MPWESHRRLRSMAKGEQPRALLPMSSPPWGVFDYPYSPETESLVQVNRGVSKGQQRLDIVIGVLVSNIYRNP